MSTPNISSRKAMTSSTPNESMMPVENSGVSATWRPASDAGKRASRKARIDARVFRLSSVFVLCSFI
jgi:hypothetical protein